ncbi:MAG: NfeD family protein [Burkholderiaceae bacterium]|nr:NfeD family protein [Burkholderiaceae bacterium]
MSLHWWWWGMAVALMAFELTTGTLYLLVLALGAAVGGLAAYGGLGGAPQVLIAAVTSLVGWFLLRRFQPRRRGALRSVQSNQDVLLDIGSRVRVDRWQPGGVSRVHYRGAAWEAVIAPGFAGEPAPGEFEIRAIEGNRLVLAPAA